MKLDLPSRIGPFEVRDRLGRGGMGVVYLAYDPPLDRLVAVKVLGVLDEDIRRRFLKEARFAARVQHPNIVNIYAVGEHDGSPYMAMEYIPGQTLAEVIRATTAVTLGRRVQWLWELASGLEYAHRLGIVHRDVKPSNLIISKDSGLLRLLDFGIARDRESDATMSGVAIGTPQYMSPEQITGLPVDARSDIFAFGVVAYELLSGTRAFDGSHAFEITRRVLEVEPTPLSEVVTGLPGDLIRLVEGCLVKAVDARVGSLTPVMASLRRIARVLDGWDEPTVVLSRTSTAAAGTPSPIRDDRRERRRQQVAVRVARAEAALAAGDLSGAMEAAEEAAMLDEHAPAVHAILRSVEVAQRERDLDVRLDVVRRALDEEALAVAEADLAALAPLATSDRLRNRWQALLEECRHRQRTVRCNTDIHALLAGGHHAAAQRRLDAEPTTVRAEPLLVEARQAIAEVRESREEAARRAAEEEARLAREAAERQAREAQAALERAALEARQEAERRAEAEEAARLAREVAEQRAREEQAAREALEAAAAGARAEEAARGAREAAERQAREAAEQQAREEQAARERADLEARDEAQRRARIAEEARQAHEAVEQAAHEKAARERAELEKSTRDQAERERAEREAREAELQRVRAEEAAREAREAADRQAREEQAARQRADRKARDERRTRVAEEARQAREAAEEAAREKAARERAELETSTREKAARERAEREAREAELQRVRAEEAAREAREAADRQAREEQAARRHAESGTAEHPGRIHHPALEEEHSAAAERQPPPFSPGPVVADAGTPGPARRESAPLPRSARTRRAVFAALTLAGAGTVAYLARPTPPPVVQRPVTTTTPGTQSKQGELPSSTSTVPGPETSTVPPETTVPPEPPEVDVTRAIAAAEAHRKAGALERAAAALVPEALGTPAGARLAAAIVADAERLAISARRAADQRGATASPDYLRAQQRQQQLTGARPAGPPAAAVRAWLETAGSYAAARPPTTVQTGGDSGPVTSTVPPVTTTVPRPTSSTTTVPVQVPNEPKGPTGPPVIDPRPAILAQLDEFERAYETRSVDAVQGVWPSMPGSWRGALEKSFREYSAVEWQYSGRVVTVTGDTASVLAEVAVTSVLGGRRIPTNRRYEFVLRSRGNAWVITDVRLK